jgi:hypothetical protein
MTWMKDPRLDAAVSSSETPERKSYASLLAGPLWKTSPARTCAKVLARPSCAPWRMEKGPVWGFMSRGTSVKLIVASLATYLV